MNKFEDKICKITKSKYSIATSSGTAALHLALHYFGIGEKDEVLLPSFTYVATANAIKYCHATPNFVDIEKKISRSLSQKIRNLSKKNCN